MEQEEFQKHILERVKKIERETFGYTFEENYKPISAREESEQISRGESPNHFIGERTEESAIQRVKSFYQNYDEVSVHSLFGDELDQYKKEAQIVEMLISKYKLQQLQKELIQK